MIDKLLKVQISYDSILSKTLIANSFLFEPNEEEVVGQIIAEVESHFFKLVEKYRSKKPKITPTPAS